MQKDYIIIGGGSIGLAIAYRLKKTHQHKSVVVLDSHESGAASVASGAMLGCFGEVTKYTFSNDANRKKFALMYDAHKKWTAWRDELEESSRMQINHTPGSYVILNAHGGALDDENFDAMINSLDEYKEPYQYVAPRDIPGLNPNNLARPLRAVYLENEGSIESEQYIKVLETAAVNVGVELTSIDTLNFIENRSGEYHISYDNEHVKAPVVVISTGAYTNSVLEKVKPTVKAMPVFAGNGVAAITKREVGKGFTATVRTANRAGSCGLHIVPMGDGYEYLGATNVMYSQPEDRLTIGLSHFLSQCAIEQLDQNIYHSFVESWRVGNRPVSLDTLPLLGSLDNAGLYVATGTFRDGLHCSPSIADALVTIINGGSEPLVEPFIPTRHFTELMSQEASVNEFAMQSVSGAYENWYRPTYYMNDSDIFSSSQKKALEIYDQLQINIGLHPDILLLLSSDSAAIDSVASYLNNNPGH